MKKPYKFKLDYGFCLLKIKLGTKNMKNQFITFLEAGDRLDRINGDKVEEDSTSQWNTITEIKDWCKVRKIQCELENKTLWAKIMDCLDRRIAKNKEEYYETL